MLSLSVWRPVTDLHVLFRLTSRYNCYWCGGRQQLLSVSSSLSSRLRIIIIIITIVDWACWVSLTTNTSAGPAAAARVNMATVIIYVVFTGTTTIIEELSKFWIFYSYVPQVHTSRPIALYGMIVTGDLPAAQHRSDVLLSLSPVSIRCIAVSAGSS